MFYTTPFEAALTRSQEAARAHGNPVPDGYTKSDFSSDQNVRWCPGCGDYAILAAMQRSCAKAGRPPHEHVFVSGIGCAARFPYYMNTYGFHTIHGRAPGVASGLALTRDDLTIWVVTGDGDGLSIGIGHLLHLIRRNLNVKVLLFNNRIYGLTKGQYSPTSERGKVTRSSPKGSLDQPFDALSLVTAAGASFVARVVDKNLKLMEEVFAAAMEHRGTAFIEIYQNCNIFNDGAFINFTDRTMKEDNALFLKENEPLRYGAEQSFVITSDGKNVGKTAVGEATSTLPEHAVIHNSTEVNPFRETLYQVLSTREDFPTPFGIFKRVERPLYEEGVQAQLDHKFLGTLAEKSTRNKSLQDFIAGKLS